MADLGSKLGPVIETLLEPGEELGGACVASEVGLLKGRQVAIGVTIRLRTVDGERRIRDVDLARSIHPTCAMRGLT